MMNRTDSPLVRRPFVLMLLTILAFYVAMATAFGQTDADSNAYVPTIRKSVPLIHYFDPGSPYDEKFWIADSDLAKPAGSETLNVQLNSSLELTMWRHDFNGPLPAGGVWIDVSARALPTHHARIPATILATDAAGHRTFYNYEIFVSDPPLYGMSIETMNTTRGEPGLLERQRLVFGFGDAGTTTGSEPGTTGRLDTNYCEYELPPAPPIQQFDARWEIPSTAGTLWNFYPLRETDEETAPAWNFTVTAGSDRDSSHLPIVFVWTKSDAARFPHPLYLSDRTGEIFRVNMATGESRTSLGVTVVDKNDSIFVTIPLAGLERFSITQDASASVGEEHARSVARIDLLPNPSSGDVEIRSSLAGARRAEIFDSRGMLVRVLSEEAIGSGRFMWNGRDAHDVACPAGVYGCRITHDTGAATAMILLSR